MRVYNPTTGKPFYQKRRRRFDEPGHAHELTFCCYRRFAFLKADRTRVWFADALQAARKMWPFELWAYVLMPEHVHLLICTRGPLAKAGKIAGQIKEAVARRAIAYLAANASHWLPRITVREGGRMRRRFWQPGGGYDRNCIEPAAIHQMIEYIHANPVRRGLVARAEDWEWSSARWYAGIRTVRIEIDDTAPRQQETPGG
jgi:putative transposase